MLVVEEPLGDVLTAATAQRLAEPGGSQLRRLAGLSWLGFPRAGAPAWHDQVTATLRAHGISPAEQPSHPEGALIAEVKVAAVRTGRAFALAPPGWAQQLFSGAVAEQSPGPYWPAGTRGLSANSAVSPGPSSRTSPSTPARIRWLALSG